MAKQTINLGTIANDGTGDQARTAGQKINDNFTELYGRPATRISEDGNYLEISTDGGSTFTKRTRLTTIP